MTPLSPDLLALPGAELVSKGIVDLKDGVESVEALLVAMGALRMKRVGLNVPAVTNLDPERSLYLLLDRIDPVNVHSRYNALVRRLVSFERALESRWGRSLRAHQTEDNWDR